MATRRQIAVHLLPALVPPAALRGSVVVVIDVLRATTTMVYALAAGCAAVYPVAEVEEARTLAERLGPGKALLGGERGGAPITGFDLGNSPQEYVQSLCKGANLVLTTTNGTRALLHAQEAERVLVAGFVNFSSTCELLLHEARAVHLLCAGTDGCVTLEDTLLAGAFVDVLSEVAGPPPRRGEKRAAGQVELELNDGARLAWDCFEHHGMILEEALAMSQGGKNLIKLGYAEDIRKAADVDRLFLTAELHRDPVRIERGRVGVQRSHWPLRG